LTRDRYSPTLQAQYRAALQLALEAGHKVLSEGGCALDAVEAAINSMENNPLFNAGKGAVLSTDGKVELEASVMVNHPLASGDGGLDVSRRTTSVTLVSRVKNPISLAKQLFLKAEDTQHVFHAAPHVEMLAERFGCEMVEESYFHTPARDRQFEDAQTGDYAGLGSDESEAKGTVGAVALDVNGFMAVGTSTGGKGGKLPGRIGDTPIPGAGYWCETFLAKRKTTLLQKIFPCLGREEEEIGMGVSGTGDGDYFLRYAVCHDVFERMKWKGDTLEESVKDVLRELGQHGGEGGMIGLTGEGEVVMGMNCGGMFRGWIDLAEGVPRVGIFSDDHVS